MVTNSELVRHTREDLQLLAIREIFRATAAALPLNDILAIIANMTIIVYDATTAWFMVAEDDELRTIIARGQFADALFDRGRIAEEESSRVASVGDEPLVLQPAEIDPADPVIGVFAREDESVTLLSLKTNGTTWGLLGVALARQAPPDITFLITLSEQAAVAIERARLREETRTWRERLDVVFERMAEPVFVFDGEGHLALMNPAAEELLVGRDVRIGDSLADMARKAGLTDAQGRPAPPKNFAVARVLRGEQVENLEVDLPVPGSPTRHLLASGAPLMQDGRIQGVVVVWRDITYIRELERMRAEFLSMVSHELRTPLTSVLGYTQLLERQLERGAPPEDLASRLRTIAEQTKRVNKLVEDLLDTSRAEAGRLALKFQEVDLTRLIRSTVDEAVAAAPEHRFTVNVPPEAPHISIDPDRIEQVLRNLLSNAAKFSPPGTEITVGLRMDPERAVVSVADQGRGISREDLSTLFMPFHRIRRAGTREIKGVGLGLFISRSIVEAHAGEMWVHSELGKGSTFYFSIPLEHRRAAGGDEETVELAATH